MIHPSCMVRRILPNGKKFVYKNRFGVNDDYFTFFELLRLGKFVNLEDYLLKYRIHHKNSSLANLKGKFLNTLKIRISAFRESNYQFYILDILLITLQTILVLLIPQKYIFWVYMACRRIYSQAVIPVSLPKISWNFSRPAKYYFAVIINLFN